MTSINLNLTWMPVETDHPPCLGGSWAHSPAPGSWMLAHRTPTRTEHKQQLTINMTDHLSTGGPQALIKSMSSPSTLRSTQPSTLRGTVKWAVTHLYGLRKVVTLVELTGAA